MISMCFETRSTLCTPYLYMSEYLSTLAMYSMYAIAPWRGLPGTSHAITAASFRLPYQICKLRLSRGSRVGALAELKAAEHGVSCNPSRMRPSIQLLLLLLLLLLLFFSSVEITVREERPRSTLSRVCTISCRVFCIPHSQHRC
jgi:hypothetical protein